MSIKARIVTVTDRADFLAFAVEQIAEVQRRGGVACLIDTSTDAHAISDWSGRVDLSSLLISCPETSEQARDVTRCLIHSGAIDLIVVRS